MHLTNTSSFNPHTTLTCGPGSLLEGHFIGVPLHMEKKKEKKLYLYGDAEILALTGGSMGATD